MLAPCKELVGLDPYISNLLALSTTAPWPPRIEGAMLSVLGAHHGPDGSNIFVMATRSLGAVYPGLNLGVRRITLVAQIGRH